MEKGGREVAELVKKMQQELVFQKLRERGCRITRQRKILLDVILQEE